MREPIPPNLFTRSLTVHEVEGPATVLRCSDCEWNYRYKHIAPKLDDVEQHYGIHGFCTHDCADFPLDAIKPLKAR